jgi:D-3-phosphoglycerate dehydrogenase
MWDDPRRDRWPEEADAVLVRQSPITPDLVARIEKAQIVSKHGIGCDAIDLAGLRAKGIPVVNTPGANSEAVAELAIALALGMSRCIVMSDRETRAGKPIAPDKNTGTSWWGKTVGIIGMGNIGRRVAKKWHGAFDMTVLGFDPWMPPQGWETLDVPVTPMETLEQMLPAIDLLTIHIPLTDESRNMIGDKEMRLMKPTASIVSDARGGIVDEMALYAALKEGRLHGAALDVFEKEPPPPDHPLFEIPGFVGTPHIGAGAVETKARCSEMAAQQILDFLAGAEPVNLVN